MLYSLYLLVVAVDKVGMTDNPYEYNAQVMIKPYCAKMLQVTDCGTVGFAFSNYDIVRSSVFL